MKTFKFFYSRLGGLILHWFIAAIKEVKILRHLRVLLNDYTNLRRKSHFNGKLSKLTRLRKKNRNISHTRPPFCRIHKDLIKKITTNSLPPRQKFVENTYNLPLKRLFYQDDLVPLFLFYSWNTGFTFQDFRSIVKLSRHRYIMSGIYKAWYILWKKTLKITRVLLFHSERQMRL